MEMDLVEPSWLPARLISESIKNGGCKELIDAIALGLFAIARGPDSGQDAPPWQAPASDSRRAEGF